jgi:hypothetical protein
MKKFFLLPFFLSSLIACSDNSQTVAIDDTGTPAVTDTQNSSNVSARAVKPKNKSQTWESTTLSDATIKHIQDAKHQYLLCISTETQKLLKINMDSRAATDLILKQCEDKLAQIRVVFTQEKVPVAITDRYIKRTRTQTARKVLQEMIIAAATR